MANIITAGLLIAILLTAAYVSEAQDMTDMQCYYKIEGRQVSAEEFAKAKKKLDINEERFLEEGELVRPAKREEGISEYDGKSTTPPAIEHEYGVETDYMAVERKTGKKFLYIVVSWTNETIYEIRPYR